MATGYGAAERPGAPVAIAGGELRGALIEALYGSALVMADEARAWFDAAARAEPAATPPLSADAAARRIALSCESLRLTTRLMHMIAWLLMQRAIAAGEVPAAAALQADNRLGPSPAIDAASLDRLPDTARQLVCASERLYQRAARLETAMVSTAAPVTDHPVHRMQRRLLLNV